MANLNFQPTNAKHEAHIIDCTAAIWLAELLEQRISTDNPVLEGNCAASLRADGTITFENEEDKDYIKQIIIANTQVDNLFKTQVLAVFE
jgi:hypothetical protein